MRPLPGRVVRHFKGGLYRILFPATSASPGEGFNPDSVFVYMALADGKIWVRSEHEFTDEVKWPDGVLRFRFVDEMTRTFNIPADFPFLALPDAG